MADITFDSLAVIVSVEQLPAAVPKGVKAVGLNISAALLKRNTTTLKVDDVQKLLSPWLWEITGVTLLVQDRGTNKCVQVKTPSMVPANYNQARSDNAAFLCRLKKHLGLRFGIAAAAGDPLFWKAGLPDLAGDKPLSAVSIPAWHLQIGDLFTLPAPIPALLNLSRIVKFAAPKGVTAMNCFAAPEFSVTLSAGKVALKPKVPNPVPDDCGLGNLPDDAKDVRIWEYESTGFAAQAYLKAAEPVADDADNLLECSTLLLRKDGLAAADLDRGDDWLTQLAPRAADGLDLARAVVETAREASDETLCPAFVQFFLAALRDQSGLGYMPGPDQQSLLGIARKKGLKQASAALPAASVGAVCDESPDGLPACAAAEAANWGDTAKWVGTLEAVPNAPAHLASSLRTLKAAAAIGNPPFDHVTLKAAADAMQVVYGIVTNEIFLVDLVLLQWQALSQGASPAMPYAGPQFISYARNNVLSVQQVRRRMLLGVLGRYWRSTLIDFGKGSAADRLKQVRANFASMWEKYIKERASASSPFYPRVQGVDTVSQQVTKHVATWAANFANTVLVPVGPATVKGETTSIAPTPVPHPLVLFAEQAAQDAASKADDQKDSLRCMRGISMMLRRKSPNPTPWRCLNVGTPFAQAIPDSQAQDCDTTDDKPVSYLGRAFRPSRIGYTSSLRQSTQSYDNAPKSADGPLAKAAALKVRARSDTKGTPPLMGFEYKKADTPPSADPLSGSFAGLLFGATYDMFMFASSNSGALNQALADPGDPTILKAALEEKIEGITDSDKYVYSMKYLRRVPVGTVRVVKTSRMDTETPVEFPAIPAGVEPWSRDVRPGDPADGKAVDEHLPEEHMLLLAGQEDFPGTSLAETMQFDVLPPLVDINTWERSVADQPAASALRKAAWTAQMGGKTPKLVDPAVAKLIFRLEKVDGSLIGEQEIGVDWKNPDAARTTVKFAIQGGRGSLKIEPPSGKVITVDVGKGEAGRLRIYVQLDAAQADKFDSTLEFIRTAKGNKLRILAFTTLVEAATPELPYAEDIMDGCSFIGAQETKRGSGFVSDGNILSVQLSPQNDLFRYIGRVEFQRQVWRWRGRPVRRFPKDNPDRISEWVAEQFGDRDDSDHLNVIPQKVDAAKDGRRTFTYTEDISKDKRGTYYRFAIRAASRYSGLTRNLALIRDTLSARDFKDQTKAHLLKWKEVLIRCRRTDEVPAPKISMIVPLTEPAADDPNVKACQAGPLSSRSPSTYRPGLLLVMDEPWFEIGGLAETLEVAVSTKREPDPNKPVDYCELGPDVIVSSGHFSDKLVYEDFSPDKQNYLTTTGTRIWQAVPPPLSGPAGHTFDTNFENPLFRSSSFILRAPDYQDPEDPKKQRFPWPMVKLMFRRRLNKDLCSPDTVTADEMRKKASQGPLCLPEGQTSDATLASAYTAGYWAQFLPPFSLDGHNLPIPEFVWENGEISNAECALEPAEGFAYFAVATVQVTDAASGSPQEAFVGLYKQNPGAPKSWNRLTPKNKDVVKNPVFIRVLEVQGLKVAIDNISKSDDFWNTLFHCAGPADALPDPDDAQAVKVQRKREQYRARIVRISKAVTAQKSGAGGPRSDRSPTLPGGELYGNHENRTANLATPVS